MSNAYIKKMLKKTVDWIDDIVFILTGLLFLIIPLALTLGGMLGIFFITMGWLFEQKIIWAQIWFILLFIIFTLMGFKWDRVIIENYPDAIEREKAIKNK